MTVICTKPTTPESRKRHVEIFGEKPDRYCKTCGRLPSFCECDRHQYMESVFLKQPPSPFANLLTEAEEIAEMCKASNLVKP